MTIRYPLCLLLFVVLMFTWKTGRTQGRERGLETTANASQFYFELGGPGVIYSFNYDGRFGPYENGIGFRLGIGGAYWNGDGYVAVPMQLNYLLGSRGKYLELAAGATYAPGLDLFGNGTDIWYGTMGISFRKQPLGKKGFTFRAGFTPLVSFTSGGSFLPFGGVSWGYRF